MNSYLDLLETELFKEGHGLIAVYGNLATGWIVKLSWPKDVDDKDSKMHTVFARGESYEDAMKNAYEGYVDRTVQ